MRPATSVQSRQTIGALQMCAGMLIIPFLDVFAKLLGATHGPFEITFWRFFMQSALMLPFVITLRLWPVPSGTLLLQAIRGLLLAMATVFFFAALKHLPMAEAIAIFFAQPMILTMLSAFMLGERLRARRIGAIVVGLVGTLIIVQPTILIFGWPAVLPLGSALSMALYMVLTRKLTSDVNPYQMQFLGSVAAMIGLGLVVLAGTVFSISGATMSMLTEREVMWVVGMGIAATLGHAFIVFAAEKAPANLLAPFQYVEIIGATALGYLVFSDVPAKSTVLGVGVIVLSGLYLFHREHVVATRDSGEA
ncbi:MAG: DMT family transporter [Pseudomonadota bacterium]|nr:DMT family transporter [Pseudomonadota bacterium]